MKKIYIILIFIFLISCQQQSILPSFVANALNLNSIQTSGQKHTTVIAHRGGARLSPENTLPAIKKSIDIKADMVEIDVRFTKDKQVVVIHDSTVDRTTNGHGSVSNMTLAQIKSLDAGSWFGNEYKNIRIPTLEEVLVLCKNKIKVNIEIKDDSAIAPTIELVKKYNMIENIYILSFDPTDLKKVKKLEPKILTAMLFNILSPLTFPVIKKLYEVDRVIFLSKVIFPSLIENAHKAGLGIMTFTVNDAVEAKKLISWNIDGIITDKPDMLINLING